MLPFLYCLFLWEQWSPQHASLLPWAPTRDWSQEILIIEHVLTWFNKARRTSMSNCSCCCYPLASGVSNSADLQWVYFSLTHFLLPILQNQGYSCYFAFGALHLGKCFTIKHLLLSQFEKVLLLTCLAVQVNVNTKVGRKQQQDLLQITMLF